MPEPVYSREQGMFLIPLIMCRPASAASDKPCGRGRGGDSGKREGQVKRWNPILLAIAVLAGCEAKLDWVDTTGQHRSDDQAKIDYEACGSEVGFAELQRNPTAENQAAFRMRMISCMAEHGWRPKKPLISN